MSVDVLLLSLGTTRGLQVADSDLLAMLRDAGASAEITAVRFGLSGRLRGRYPSTDFIEGYSARRALAHGIRRHRPRSLILATSTNALLTDKEDLPFAVWFDAPGRENRPGLRNSAIHVLERRSFRRASVLMPWSLRAMAELPREMPPAVPISPPISGGNGSQSSAPRERLVVAYTPEPWAKGLELVCRTWKSANETADARLLITGITRDRALAHLKRFGLELPPGAELPGMVTQSEFHELLGRAQVFLSGAIWEDFGLAPLEALSRGAVLVTTPGRGPFPALPIARLLEPRFVATELSPDALRDALTAALNAPDDDLARYRARALELLEPYRRRDIVARLRDEVLPHLLM
jgi:hypothetical protein